INIRAFDLGYRAINNGNGYITLINNNRADSVVTQIIRKGEGHYRAEFDLVPPGLYDYYGRIEQDGRLLKEATGQIAVENFAIEEYYRQPDFAQLSNISRLTGGKFFKAPQADSIYAVIDTMALTIETRSEIVLWNKIWLLISFILALGIEWFLRKRYQLI
ncbi:MAG: hypothetical protein ABIJ45_10365, partial [Candidatus Zixiibacteriota bacterium]